MDAYGKALEQIRIDPLESELEINKRETLEKINSLDQNDPLFDEKLKQIQENFKQKLREEKIYPNPPGFMNPDTKQLINPYKLALVDEREK